MLTAHAASEMDLCQEDSNAEYLIIPGNDCSERLQGRTTNDEREREKTKCFKI